MKSDRFREIQRAEAVRRDGLFQGGAAVMVVVGLFFALGCAPWPWGQNRPTGLVAMEPVQYNAIDLAIIPDIKLPSSVDLTDDMPPAGDQGDQGSCVAWAVAYALKTHQEQVERTWGADTTDHQFSPAYVYNQIKVGGCNSGARIPDGFTLLANQGCCTLATMPYDDSACDDAPPATARAEAQTYRIASWRRVDIQNTAELRSHLAAGSPIVIGMEVYTNFFRLSGDAIYDDIGGNWEGNHALCVIGYDDAAATFRVLNSWGAGWGDQGYFRITYALFRQIVFEAYVAQDLVAGKLLLDVSATGQGRVHVSPVGGTYETGTQVELTAVPADGWRFVEWQDAQGHAVNPMILAIDADTAVTAVFEEIEP